MPRDARDKPGADEQPGAGFAAEVLPAEDFSAAEHYYHEDVTVEPFGLNPDSTIDVPEMPGLGVTGDRRALAKYTLRQTVTK